MNWTFNTRVTPMALTFALALLGPAFGVSRDASAASTTTLGISLTIVDSCTIATAPFASRHLGPSSGGSVTQNCSSGAAPTITFEYPTRPLDHGSGNALPVAAVTHEAAARSGNSGTPVPPRGDIVVVTVIF
jgi:hypothetical protein